MERGKITYIVIRVWGMIAIDCENRKDMRNVVDIICSFSNIDHGVQVSAGNGSENQ